MYARARRSPHTGALPRSCFTGDGKRKFIYDTFNAAAKHRRKWEHSYPCEYCGGFHNGSGRGHGSQPDPAQFRRPAAFVFCARCGWVRAWHPLDEPFLCRCVRRSLIKGLLELAREREARQTQPEEPDIEREPGEAAD